MAAYDSSCHFTFVIFSDKKIIDISDDVTKLLISSGQFLTARINR